MVVADALCRGEIARRFHRRHWVRAVQRERVASAEVVPHRFQFDRGGDVAVVPQQGDHLSEHTNGAAVRRDDVSDVRFEGGGVQRTGLHELPECLACVEGAVEATHDEIADRETVQSEGSFESGAMFGRRDGHDPLVPAESFSKEIGHHGNQVVVAVVEADEMFVTWATNIVRERAHRFTVARGRVIRTSLSATR